MSFSDHALCLQERPMIEPTASPDASPLDAGQANSRPPTAYPPSYSVAIPSAEASESFVKFREFPAELRHSIWEKSLPEPRTFDDNTLQLLRTQPGAICFDLIPPLLHGCHESRTFAQGRLCQTVLFQTRPQNGKKIIYFNPERDVYRYRFTNLLWQHDFPPRQCLFSIVEMYVNIELQQYSDTFSFGPKTVRFRDQFPNLKRLIVTDQHTYIHEDGLSDEGPNQRSWNREWRSVLLLLLENSVHSIMISLPKPETHGKLIADFMYIPEDTDTHNNPKLLSADADKTGQATSNEESKKQDRSKKQICPSPIVESTPPLHASEVSQHVNLSAVVCYGQKPITPDPDVTSLPRYLRIRRADGSYTCRQMFASGGQFPADSDATELFSEDDIQAAIERNFSRMNGTQDQAHLALQRDVEFSCPHHQYRRTCGDLSRDEFDSDKDLVFYPPVWTRSLADLELDNKSATSSFAVSGGFPLFSAAAVEKMRDELLTNKVGETFQTSTSMVPERAKFTYNAWRNQKTIAAISKVVGIDLVPVMDIEISRVNVLGSSSLLNKHSVGWHRDDYPYACVLVLSDTTHIIEGHTLLKTGSGAILVCDCQNIGFAYVIQGHCIEHAIQAFKGCSHLIIAVTAFRPRCPSLPDQTQLRHVYPASDLSQLYSQFYQYRMTIISERLTALAQVLDGIEVPGWVWKSPLLGENVK